MKEFNLRESLSAEAWNHIKFLELRKKAGVMYLLWFFVGGLGLHNFYIERNVMGSVQLSLTLGALLMSAIFAPIGVILWVSAFICWISDLFFLPSQLNIYNYRLAVKWKQVA